MAFIPISLFPCCGSRKVNTLNISNMQLTVSLVGILLHTLGASATWTAYEEYLSKLPKHPSRRPSPRPPIVFEPKQPWQPFPETGWRHRECYVKSHNDFKTDDSPYILEAIDKCNNGGRVIFPQGMTYVIGTALNLTYLNCIDLGE